MTRKQLRRRLIAAVLALAAVLGAGVFLKVHRIPLIGMSDERVGYGLVKDMSPLLLGILAVLLANWYQQRMAFLQAMRALWSRMIDAKVAMLAYAATPTKTDDAYRSAYRQISCAIDEMRTVYRNVGENDRYIGWYPYEPLNDMRKAFEDLRADSGDGAAEHTRERIESSWAALRWRFLEEFGAPEPTNPMIGIGEQPSRRQGPRPHNRIRQTRN
jgi:hypothetical protein